jgi:hypothetical protein
MVGGVDGAHRIPAFFDENMLSGNLAVAPIRVTQEFHFTGTEYGFQREETVRLIPLDLILT